MALYQVAIVEKIVLDSGLPTQRIRENIVLTPVTVAASDEKLAVAKAARNVVLTDDMEIIVVPF